MQYIVVVVVVVIAIICTISQLGDKSFEVTLHKISLHCQIFIVLLLLLLLLYYFYY